VGAGAEVGRVADDEGAAAFDAQHAGIYEAVEGGGESFAGGAQQVCHLLVGEGQGQAQFAGAVGAFAVAGGLVEQEAGQPGADISESEAFDLALGVQQLAANGLGDKSGRPMTATVASSRASANTWRAAGLTRAVSPKMSPGSMIARVISRPSSDSI